MAKSCKSAAAWKLPTFDQKSKAFVLHEASLKIKKASTFGREHIKWCVLTTECLLFYSGNEDTEKNPGKMNVNILMEGPSSRGELVSIFPLIGEGIKLVLGNTARIENVWNINTSSSAKSSFSFLSNHPRDACASKRYRS